VGARRTVVAAAAVVVGAALTAACSGGGAPAPHPAATTTTAFGSPRPSAPTVTTPGPPSPLTGLPTTDLSTLARPALSVKIDNAPSARPQAGLDQADLVTEELVEGGLTRFLATFQSQDAAAVGPIRSGRLVDANLLKELGGGIFAYSGAATGELAVIRADSGALLLTPDDGDAGFRRDPSRPAPSNLFTSTAALYRVAASRGPALPPPPEIFTFQSEAPPGVPGTTVAVTFSGAANAVWTWTPATGTYARDENGTPHLLADGRQVAATDVVILGVDVRPSGYVDAAHNPVPEVLVTGSGPCWVLRDGIVEQGRWQRAVPSSPLALTDGAGAPLTLRPGRVWMELLPNPGVPVIH